MVISWISRRLNAASHVYLEKYIDIKLHGFPTKLSAKWVDLFVKIDLNFEELIYLFIVMSWITRLLIAVSHFY